MHHSASKIDLSKDGDSSVVGWMEDTTFKVSSQVSGMKIMANEDSGNMFNGYKNNACQNVISITGLEKIDTSSVTNMSSMFNGCQSLKTIYVGSGWNTSNVTSSFDMFSDCTSLVGQSGTTYNSSKVDKTMANWETGYLTYKAH